MAKGFKTGGRKKGSKNKRSVASEAAKGGELPLEYMLRVMRDRRASPERRDTMAEKAAPYLHAKLASIQHTGRDGGPIEHVDVTKLSDHELAELSRIQRKLGVGPGSADPGGDKPTGH